jgi:hypothetical protein
MHGCCSFCMTGPFATGAGDNPPTGCHSKRCPQYNSNVDVAGYGDGSMFTFCVGLCCMFEYLCSPSAPVNLIAFLCRNGRTFLWIAACKGWTHHIEQQVKFAKADVNQRDK